MDATDKSDNSIKNAIPSVSSKSPNPKEKNPDVTLQANLKALDCQIERAKKEFKNRTATIVSNSKKKLTDMFDNFARQGEVINTALKIVDNAVNEEESRSKRLRIDLEAKHATDQTLITNCKKILNQRSDIIKGFNEFLRTEILEYGAELSEHELKLSENE